MQFVFYDILKKTKSPSQESLLRGCDISLPKRFLLPVLRKSHGGNVNRWKVVQQLEHFVTHIVLRRDGVKEIFDYAKVKIDAQCVGR